MNQVGIAHIALSSNAIAEGYDMLSADGVSFNSTLIGAAPTRFVYGRDPFGNVIELFKKNPD